MHFRSGLIRGLAREGYKIVVAAPRDAYSPLLEELHAEFVELPISSSGSSIVEDINLFFRYLQVVRRVRPAAFLGFTVKPNIYGSLAARMAGAKVINNVTGLGTAFIKPGPLTLIVTELYRLALRGSSTVFFQNREDLDFFVVARGLPGETEPTVIPGDGSTLTASVRLERAPATGPFRFLLHRPPAVGQGRRRICRGRADRWPRPQPDVVFQILGPAGVDNRTAVPSDKLADGGPRASSTILEKPTTCGLRWNKRTALCCRPIARACRGRCWKVQRWESRLIATDVPGCRDVVIDGETGYLCAARSAEALGRRNAARCSDCPPPNGSRWERWPSACRAGTLARAL